MIGILVAHAADLQLGVPGPIDLESAGLLGMIQNVYLIALGAAGLLALGSIVYGAIQYAVSRGNPSKLSDAWDRILQAFFGILLLVGAATILSVINPGLASLQLPNLESVDVTKYQGGIDGEIPVESSEAADESIPASPTGKNTIIAPTSSCKQDPSKCVAIPVGRDGFGSCATKPWNRCKTHENIMKSVTCAAEKTKTSKRSIYFNTGYPAGTYKHADPGHTNGCSADISVISLKTCAEAEAFVAAIYSCGGAALNEYAYGAFKGCGKKTATANGGNHIHVYGCPSGTK